MDAMETIKARRSIRVFEKRIPPRETIAQCLEAAAWAPSATNQQPWEFVVAAGAQLEKICGVISEKFAERMQGTDPYGDVPADCRQRQQDILGTLEKICEKEAVDPSGFFESMLRFFDAPVGVYFVTRKHSDRQYLLSTAAALENFLLAARASGLGTCWLTVTVVCQEDIKELLGISEDRELLAGVALGYPAQDSPFNTFQRTRVPAGKLTTWLGF